MLCKECVGGSQEWRQVRYCIQVRNEDFIKEAVTVVTELVNTEWKTDGVMCRGCGGGEC